MLIKNEWLSWLILCATFLLYCAMFWPEPGGPRFTEILVWALGLGVLFFGGRWLGVPALLAVALALYFVSEAVESNRVIGAVTNPVIPAFTGVILGLSSVVLLALAVILGVRNKIRG